MNLMALFMKGEKEINPAKTKSLYQLLTFGSLCNNANIIQKKKGVCIRWRSN